MHSQNSIYSLKYMNTLIILFKCILKLFYAYFDWVVSDGNIKLKECIGASSTGTFYKVNRIMKKEDSIQILQLHYNPAVKRLKPFYNLMF